MIIKKALLLLKNQLKDYLESRGVLGSDTGVLLDSPTKEKTDQAQKVNDCVLLTLFRIEEEKTMRNNASYRKTGLNGKTTYANPDIFLNLFVLVSANFTQYENALTALSYALEFFQSKNTFNAINSPDAIFDNMSPAQKSEFELHIELHTISTEQTRNVWEVFKDNLLPHFILKVWLVSVSSGQIQSTGEPITEIEAITSVN